MVDIQNKEDIYGDLLPDVFIEKITLENSGFFPIQTNPHIDNEREEIIVRKTANSLKVRLDLTIKQKLENDSLVKWLDDLDFKKYFIIKVFQVKDAKLAALAQLTKDVILLFDPDTFSFSKKSIRKLCQGHLNLKDEIELKHFCEKNVSAQSIAINHITKELKGENTIEILDDGTEIVNTNFSKSFQNEEQEIGHLSYYAVSQFEINSLIEDFELSQTDKLAEFLLSLSKVKSEIVFDNFEIKSESYVYLDQNSNIWNGDVHEINGEFRSGIEEDQNSAPLIKRNVNNSVIQDFRIRQQSEKISFDFDPLRAYFNKLIKRNLGTSTSFLSRDNSLFSDLEISLDSDNEVNLMFSLDLKNTILKNSPYFYLIKNYKSPLARELTKQVKIKSLKMFRKRVKPKQAADKFIYSSVKYEPFTKNEISELMFHVSKIDEIIVDTEKFFLRTINNPFSENIIQLSGTDRSISTKTKGIYQYSFEMEFEDPFVQYINDDIEILNRIRAILLKYYSECQKTSLTKIDSGFDNPHIKSTNKGKKRKILTEGNYNSITDSFTKSFARRMTEAYPDIGTSPWVMCNLFFTDIASKFLQNIEKEVFLKQLINYTSPFTGNPSGVKFVLELMDQFLSSLQKIIKTNLKIDSLSPTGRTIAKKQNNIRIVNTFSNIVDLESKPKIFLNFINKTSSTPKLKNGLTTILQSEYQQRVDNEVLRFFRVANPNPQIIGGTEEQIAINFETKKYSYLTPISITDGRRNTEIEIKDFTQNNLEQELREREFRYLLSSAQNGVDSELYYKNNGALLNIDHGLTSFNKLLISNNVIIKGYEISSIINNFVRETIRKADLESGIKLNNKEKNIQNQTNNEAAVEIPNTQGPVTDFLNIFYSSYNVPRPAATSFYYPVAYQQVVGYTRRFYYVPYIFHYRGQRIVRNQRRVRYVPRYETRTRPQFDQSKYFQQQQIWQTQRDAAADQALNLKNYLETDPERIFQLPPQQLAFVLGDNQANLSLVPQETKENIAIVRDRKDVLLGSMKEIIFQQGYEEGENGEILLNKPIWKIMTPQNIAIFPKNTEILCRIADLSVPNRQFNDVSKSFHISDRSFVMKITSENVPDIDTINGPYFEISVPSEITGVENSQTRKINKDFYDLAIKTHTEQAFYSTAYIQSSEVSRKSIEQVINSADVSSEIRRVQQEVTANNNTPPLVSQT